MRALLQWGISLGVFFGALLVASVVAELVPQLQQLDAWIEERNTMLFILTGAIAGAGVLVLIGSVLFMAGASGEQMTHGAVEEQQRAIRDAAAGPHLAQASTYRVIGETAGTEVSDTFSLPQLKRAVADGTVVSDPVWRRRACATCGGLLIFLGVFCSLLVVSPLPLKLLVFAAFTYGLAHILWAVIRA